MPITPSHWSQMAQDGHFKTHKQFGKKKTTFYCLTMPEICLESRWYGPLEQYIILPKFSCLYGHTGVPRKFSRHFNLLAYVRDQSIFRKEFQKQNSGKCKWMEGAFQALQHVHADCQSKKIFNLFSCSDLKYFKSKQLKIGKIFRIWKNAIHSTSPIK